VVTRHALQVRVLLGLSGSIWPNQEIGQRGTCKELQTPYRPLTSSTKSSPNLATIRISIMLRSIPILPRASFSFCRHASAWYLIRWQLWGIIGGLSVTAVARNNSGDTNIYYRSNDSCENGSNWGQGNTDGNPSHSNVNRNQGNAAGAPIASFGLSVLVCWYQCAF
jgi:hypothetical protein